MAMQALDVSKYLVGLLSCDHLKLVERSGQAENVEKMCCLSEESSELFSAMCCVSKKLSGSSV